MSEYATKYKLFLKDPERYHITNLQQAIDFQQMGELKSPNYSFELEILLAIISAHTSHHIYSRDFDHSLKIFF